MSPLSFDVAMTRLPWLKVKAMWVGVGERAFFTTATLTEVGGAEEEPAGFKRNASMLPEISKSHSLGERYILIIDRNTFNTISPSEDVSLSLTHYVMVSVQNTVRVSQKWPPNPLVFQSNIFSCKLAKVVKICMSHSFDPNHSFELCPSNF